MEMSEAVELKEVDSVNKANAALLDGWKLLAVVPAESGTTYVLGKKAGRPQIPRGIKPVSV